MGLVDLSEQKKISIIQIAVCIVLFLVAGFVSYKYLLSPEIKKLHNARVEYNKEKGLLKSMSDEALRVNALANNAQILEAELVSMRNRVFNSDAEVLTFVRTLPILAVQTNNNLTAITPMDSKEILAPGTAKTASSGGGSSKDKSQDSAQTAPPPPRTLPSSLKPIDVSFIGDYNAVIGFFNALKSMDQYVTVSNLSMSGGREKTTDINVKATLNLLKMGIVVNSPQIQVAKLSNNAANQAKTVANKQPDLTLTQKATKTIISNQNAIYAQRNAQTTVQVATSPQNAANQVPVSMSKSPVNTALAQKTVIPVSQTASKTQPSSIPKQTTSNVSVAMNNPKTVSAKTTQQNQRLMPIQSAKQTQNSIQTKPKANTNNVLATSPKSTGNKIDLSGKTVSAQASKPPLVVTQKSSAEPNTGNTTKPIGASVNASNTKTQNQTAAVMRPSPKTASTSAQSVKPAVKKRQFAVRVGKFANYKNAENLVKMLQSHDYQPWVKPYTNNGKTTYWVYVGAFETKEKAESFAESMQKRLAYIDDYVIMGIKSGRKDS